MTSQQISVHDVSIHYDVIKRNHFPHYCPFVRGIHRPPVDSPHKGTVTGTFDDSLLQLELTTEQTLDRSVIRDAMTLI